MKLDTKLVSIAFSECIKNVELVSSPKFKQHTQTKDSSVKQKD